MNSLGQCLLNIYVYAFKRQYLKYNFDLIHKNGCSSVNYGPNFNP